jgi:uncharacterized protein (TIGR00730 family)
MGSFRRLCVFCGAATGRDPGYVELAQAFGRLLASEGIGVVTGGGRVGLMGAVAEGALASGGTVIGVIPQGLVERELAHAGLTQLDVVGGLHERKARMAELVDGFVALPGGLGTLEELAEVLSWAQLGLHQKPIGVLDVGGYWAALFAWLDQAIAEGFVPAQHRDLLVRAEDGASLLTAMAAWEPVTDRWA